jgi:hypothetical protein
MKISNSLKQYLALCAVTAVAVIVYLMCYQNGISELISIDYDKNIDGFIKVIIDNNGNLEGSILSECNYNIQNIVMLILGKITGNMYIGVNIYYVISFFLISITSYWCMRKFAISPLVSIGISVLIAFVPYHVNRGEGQMIASSFFIVPLFIGMMYDIIYKEQHNCILKSYMVLSCLAPFIDVQFSTMMVIIALILAVHRWNKNILKLTLLYMMPCMILTFLISALNGMIGRSDLEQNIEVAEEEGLRILDFIMPIRYHIVGKLNDLRLEYDVGFSANGESGLNTLGVLFTIGFVCCILSLFFENKNNIIRWLGWINILVILVSNIHGFNLLIEYVGFHVLYWNRMGILVIITSAITVGIIVEHLKKFIVNNAIFYPMYVATVLVAYMELLLRSNM